MTFRGWIGVSAVLLALLTLILVALRFGVAKHAAYADWQRQYIALAVIVYAAATLIFAAVQGTSDRGRSRLVWGLTCLLVIEGVWNAHFPRQKRWETWDHPPDYVAYLQQNAGMGRVFTMGGALYANAGSAFKIFQLDSLMAFNPPRIYQLYNRYAKGWPLFPQACIADSTRAGA